MSACDWTVRRLPHFTTAKLCVQRLFVVLCHPQRILFYRTVLAHMQMASVWSEMDQLLAVHQFTAL